jgi:hypothetical protein
LFAGRWGSLVVVAAALVMAPAAFAGAHIGIGAVEDAAVWNNPGP